jgi:hypothetical protein
MFFFPGVQTQTKVRSPAVDFRLPRTQPRLFHLFKSTRLDSTTILHTINGYNPEQIWSIPSFRRSELLSRTRESLSENCLVGSTSQSQPATVIPDDDRSRRIREKADRFRVLVIGRANAGKTTILQKVCNTSEQPEIFNSKGEKVRIPSTQDLHGAKNADKLMIRSIYQWSAPLNKYDTSFDCL